jgi:hypothetical protein
VGLGGCGRGRTTLLHALADRLGRSTSQYVDIERAASTPERFYHALVTSSPFVDPGLPEGTVPTPANARDAFDRTLAFFLRARTPDGQAATFLLDEVLDLRTFENFPGLRRVLRELVDAIAESPNRFVCSSRYTARTHRVLRDATARFEVIHLPPLSVSDVSAMLPADAVPPAERDEVAASVQALADGRATYVHALGDAMGAMRQGGGDPVSALTALLATEGSLATWCGYRYELRLHRARGYGALKAILEILAEDEPLNLTEIALRLHRTPGSTKDYLTWLEDVDLVVSRQKRYTFADPLLRLWVRLHARSMPPGVDDVAREVQAYALARLPRADRGLAGAASTAERKPSWGIIEID